MTTSLYSETRAAGERMPTRNRNLLFATWH